MLKHQRGSLMIETLVSMLIIMGGVLALVSVASTTINQVAQTKYRNDASNLASEIIGQMYTNWDGVTAFNHSTWDSKVGSTLPDGQVDAFDITTGTAGSQVDIRISWLDKDSRHTYVTSTVIAK